MHAFKSTGSANTHPFSPFTEAKSDSLRLSFLDYVLYHPHRWWRIWPTVSRDSLPGQSRLPWAAGFCELSLGEESRSISWVEIHKASRETGKQAQCETDSCNRWLIHCLSSRHCVFVHVGGVYLVLARARACITVFSLVFWASFHSAFSGPILTTSRHVAWQRKITNYILNVQVLDCNVIT